MLPVAGHGAGLRPGLLSSVEPIGMPGFEVAGVEALDCKDVALPVAKAPPHVGVTGPADPGSVAPVMIPTPLLSNSAVELDVRSEEHTSELQSQFHLVCRLLLEKKKK